MTVKWKWILKTMKTNVIGITGFARSGKDTFYNYSSKILDKANCTRYAFADALKDECDSFLKDNVGISSFTEDLVDKEFIRPFLVTYGTHLRRKKDPNCWVKKVERLIQENISDSSKNFVFITDVRFKNEAEWVKSLGGYIFQITRDGFGPANEEEHVQSALIKPLVDFHVMWPTLEENIDSCIKYIKPIIKKNFREHTSL